MPLVSLKTQNDMDKKEKRKIILQLFVLFACLIIANIIYLFVRYYADGTPITLFRVVKTVLDPIILLCFVGLIGGVFYRIKKK